MTLPSINIVKWLLTELLCSILSFALSGLKAQRFGTDLSYM